MLKRFLGIVPAYTPRQFLSFSMVLLLSWTTIACGSPAPQQSAQGGGQLAPRTTVQPNAVNQTAMIVDGKYDVQQATYNDGNGEYTLFLLNTPPEISSPVRTAKLQMAQLTPEEIAASQAAYLEVKAGQPALHIPKDFKLEYVHNVVEPTQNLQTGQVEQRVVRQESNFWSPFAGAIAGQIAGQVIGNMFRPQYYVPPLYQRGGGGLSGYGGYGNSYGQANTSYRERYNQPPLVERNRTAYRSTQRSTPSFGSVSQPRTPFNSSSSQRSTGKGFGSSTLGTSKSSGGDRRPSSTFGSGRSSSFGSRSAPRGRRR